MLIETPRLRLRPWNDWIARRSRHSTPIRRSCWIKAGPIDRAASDEKLDWYRDSFQGGRVLQLGGRES